MGLMAFPRWSGARTRNMDEIKRNLKQNFAVTLTVTAVIIGINVNKNENMYGPVRLAAFDAILL